MSERGSFVTQYIYCDECLKKIKKILLRKNKYLTGWQIKSWIKGKYLPIVGGKVGGLYSGEELDLLRYVLFNEENAPCHPVKIAIIPDTAEPKIVVLTPEGEVDDYKEFKENGND